VLECQKTKEKFVQSSIEIDIILLEKISMFLKIVVNRMNTDNQNETNKIEFITDSKNFGYDIEELSNKLTNIYSLEDFIRQSL